MKLLVERGRFARELAFVSQVLIRRPANPQLNAVVVALGNDRLRLIARDESTMAMSELPTSSAGNPDRSFVISPRLHRPLKRMSVPWLTLDVGEDIVTVTSGRSKYRQPQSVEAGAVPTITVLPEHSASLHVAKFLALFEKVRPFACRNNIKRFNIAGIWFELEESHVTAMASDGLLAVAITTPDPLAGENTNDRPMSVHIPRELFEPLRHIADDPNARLLIGKTATELVLSCNGRILQRRLEAENKPPIETLFSADDSNAVVAAADLLLAIKRLGISACDSEHKEVRIISSTNALTFKFVHPKTSSVFQENIDADGAGGMSEFSVSINLLTKAAGLFASGKVLLSGMGNHRGLLLKQDGTRCAIRAVVI